MLLVDTISISIAMIIIIAFHIGYVMYGSLTFSKFASGGSSETLIGMLMWTVHMIVIYILWWLLYCTFRFLTGL